MGNNIVEVIVRAVDKTKAGLTSPIKNIEDLQKSVSNLTPAFAAVGTAVAAAFVAMSKHAVNVADETNKLAQRAGVTTEAFSTMGYAFGLAGGDAQKLAIGFKNLNKSINEAADPGSKAADVFQQLGISAVGADGSLRKADEVMLDLADKFSQTADGAGKVAAASALLGKSGEEMIPFLNQGRTAIEGLRNEAKIFGLEIGGAAAQSAEDFNDNLTKLKASVQGVAQQFVAGILPVLVDFTAALVSSAKETGFFNGLAQTLVDIFKGMVFSLRLVWFGFQTLGKMIGTVASIAYDFFYGIIFNAIGILMSISDSIIAVVKGLINLGEAAGRVGEILYHFFSGNFKQAWESSKSTVEEMKNAVVQVGKDIADSWTTNGKIAGDVLVNSWENIKAASKELGKDLSQDWKNFADFTTKLFEGQTIKGPKTENKPIIPAVGNTDAIRKASQEIQQIIAEMNANLLTGSKKLEAEEDARYQKRLDQIANLKATEEEKRAATLLAEQEHTAKLEDMERQHLQIKADLEQAAKDADLAATVQFLESKRALDLADYEGRQQMITAYSEMWKVSHRNMWSYSAELMNTFYQSFSQHVTNAILGTEKWGEAFKNIGKAIIASIVQMAVQWVASQIIMAVAGKAIMAASAALSISTAAAVGSAWAVAATGALIATFGAAAASAALFAPTVAANQAFAVGASFAGVAHSGLDYVPREGTYLLDEGEAVLNKAENAARLQNQGMYGGGPTEVNVYLDGDLLGRSLIRLAKNGRLNVMLNES